MLTIPERGPLTIILMTNSTKVQAKFKGFCQDLNLRPHNARKSQRFNFPYCTLHFAANVYFVKYSYNKTEMKCNEKKNPVMNMK